MPACMSVALTTSASENVRVSVNASHSQGPAPKCAIMASIKHQACHDVRRVSATQTHTQLLFQLLLLMPTMIEAERCHCHKSINAT